MQDEQSVGAERRGARTRRKVLEAALEVVEERPLAEVQLQHIAARVGISPGHVLYHFGSKDHILVEALRWSEETIARERARELSQIDDPAAQLGRWIVLFLPRGEGDPTWKLWLELWLRSTIDEELREIPRVISERWIADLDRILDAGFERGTFTHTDRDGFVTRSHSLLVGLSIGVLAGWQDLEGAKRIAFEAIGGELESSILDRWPREGFDQGNGSAPPKTRRGRPSRA